jgi:hypothetical protein
MYLCVRRRMSFKFSRPASWVGVDISRDELQRTCVQVAHRLTALPDVTAAGALAVEVHNIESTGASFDSAGIEVAATLGVWN